jgi:hypothetical protein
MSSPGYYCQFRGRAKPGKPDQASLDLLKFAESKLLQSGFDRSSIRFDPEFFMKDHRGELLEGVDTIPEQLTRPTQGLIVYPNFPWER